ncbi:MAG TPA: hypothetical protein VNT75_12425, partial [Symbiobacteriaceae bacterium]|nr:hypothetical protein [Symbiobacteriaceae bacterium]
MAEGWPILAIEGTRNTDLESALVSLLVEETWEGLYRCEATFDNWSYDGYVYDDRSVLDFGKKLEVKIGEESSAVLIFDGKIMGLEGVFPRESGPLLSVLADDRLHDLRMTRRTRGFEEMSDSAIISQVIGDAGLTASVSVTGVEQHALVV